VLLVVLLVTGLLSFGLVGMIVYLVLAPSDDAPERRVGAAPTPSSSPDAWAPAG
jgi:hypothetical protein